ncbi:RecQ family ATP-dependent DNA helicase [Candidatus Saccharibacteria bacterium]|nr:RecQ family ATP-dependent DNA helicase [Candidatus Saccharibacteria bacterium]
MSRLNGDVINLHHILPEQFGGKEEPDNLITLCDIHHKSMHAEFHAFYPDSQSVLLKMNRLTKTALSKIRRAMGVDDGYDLRPYLYFLTKQYSFRPGQLTAIRAALSGRDVLFVTPTGSGKSVCYQMPGLLGGSASLVISPLNALMKDQMESIWSKKIPTTYINSELSPEEKRKRYSFIRQHLYKFIFVAPERFDSKDPLTSNLYTHYSHLVVDEAHAIDMWGMAFRPSYRKLGEIRRTLGDPPVIALTATASKETQKNITTSLNMKRPKVIVTGFEKKNIEILVHRAHERNFLHNRNIGKLEYIYQTITGNPDHKIIIFVPTVKRGDELLSELRFRGLEVEFYHSKLEPKVKMQIQNRFTGIQKPGLRVLISTSAFGMGIDIPDIRHVIHLMPAQSITDYVQQIGRAGRDGRQSYAHLLYEPADNGLLEYMAERSLHEKGFKEKHGYTDKDVEQVKRKLLTQVEDMINLTRQPKGKEWKYILDYFGEVPPRFWDMYGKWAVDAFLIALLVVVTWCVAQSM